MTRPTMSTVLAAGGGFLVAVLWMDLLFDTLVVGHPPAPEPLPEAVLAAIAAYYRRATTEAHPLELLIAGVMAVTVLGSALDVRNQADRMLRVVALALCTAPVALAAWRIVPDAAALGARTGTIAAQSDLARAIFRNHLWCLAAVVAFLAVRLRIDRARGPDQPPRDVRASSASGGRT